jgi:hypothetical protein
MARHGAQFMRRERTLATTRIASWDARVNGIDDAAACNLPITSILSLSGVFVPNVAVHCN